LLSGARVVLALSKSTTFPLETLPSAVTTSHALSIQRAVRNARGR
jgi:hypothetical protein